MRLSFSPTLDRTEVGARLAEILVPGPILDPHLRRRIERLAVAFDSFAKSYPLPIWAPGLVVDHEMRGLGEALFPVGEVRPVFDLLLRLSCRIPLYTGTYLHGSPSWLDFLSRQYPPLPCADPSRLLSLFARDEKARERFIFSLMLPHHYGGGFDRYPLQLEWLSGWLCDGAARFNGGIRILDSACGSGEGTYQAAQAAIEAGIGGKGCVVHGSTLEPFELFAAAHAFFPHDPAREADYRARVTPIFEEGDAPSFEFYLDRVEQAPEHEPYHLVLCNGLLGGPLLHEPEELARAFAGLAARLLPGGVLVATDRFHEGWKRLVPAGMREGLMRESGLEPLEVPEGIGGVKL